jgi:hypothetical protein
MVIESAGSSQKKRTRKSRVATAVSPPTLSDRPLKIPVPPEAIGKQAIVVVHGQGQQKPMGTIREFVTSLWQHNPHLTTDQPPADKGREYWIVPDGKSGLFELQRITTPPYEERRTDFFELYYADLLENTPVRNLWRWLQRLLFVDRVNIPPRMMGVWLLLWAVTVFTVALSVAVAANLPTILHAFWFGSLFYDLPDDQGRAPNIVAWIGVAILATTILTENVPRFFDALKPLKAIPVGVLRLALLFGFGLVVWPALPIFGAVLLIAIGYVGANFVLPLFGDAASYLSAQSETVQSRQDVRTRGLTLLRELHNDPAYHRIIIVAHSLGTVVAYDLLQLLWEGVGPTKDNPPDKDQLAALKKVEAYVATMPRVMTWSQREIEAYQALQWAAFKALRRQGPKPAAETTAARPAGWKVSDFITLGSPLGNAEFLVAEGKGEFRKLKEERLMPTSPPQPFDTKKSATSFFDPDGPWTHHAAVFSTVRWTNIFDPVDPGWRVWRGDFITAPVAGHELFGEGVLDQQVRILTANGKRGFTHNFYWGVPGEKWVPESDHLKKLRDAVGIMRR